MRTAALILILGSLTGSLGACVDTDPIEPEAAAIGTYTLTEVDGAVLPYTFHPAPLRMQVTAGTTRLDGDGTFEETFTHRVQNTDTGEETVETETRTGSWAMDTGVLSLTGAGGGVTYSAVRVRDGRLTYTATGEFSFDLTLVREE